ncbi:hypothetical protein SteCoe_16664 [Stentor coeruleus]|uniref:Uncharacterized protein n=1 Tax=Stentor coeruleus TaxID=5963 RepID=A0A1R2C109_9CILI|nr:hypothetical protein SteCoe_16664 [Stentor coeruleus]
MESQGVFNIPNALKSDNKFKYYKSSETSPKVYISQKYTKKPKVRKATNSCTEMDLNFKREKKSRNSADLTVLPKDFLFEQPLLIKTEEIHKEHYHEKSSKSKISFDFTNQKDCLTAFDKQKERLFKNMEQQKERVKLMQKMLTSTQPNYEIGTLDINIKEKTLENRFLAETIKNLSLTTEITTKNTTEDIISKVSTIEIDVLNMQKALEKLKKTYNLNSKKSQLVNLQDIENQNKTLEKQVFQVKKNIGKYFANPDEFIEAKKKQSLISEKYASGLSENANLQQQLINLRKSNFARSSYGRKDNMIDLAYLLADVSKLAGVAKVYFEKNSIDLTMIYKQETLSKYSTSQEYLENIKKQLEGLRMSFTDIYAEQCGSSCYTQ